MVIVDTNIIIEHLRKPKGANTFFREILGTYPLGTVGISVLSIQELYEGKSMDDFADEQYAKEAISLLQVLGYKAEVARLAGEIARHNRTAMDFPDAGIAATAIANNATLITYNTKDFKDIKGLELL